jgi:hypothetical protein
MGFHSDLKHVKFSVETVSNLCGPKVPARVASEDFVELFPVE